MSNTRTLQKPYPKEKDPFHEDSTKSKSRIKRTFSSIKHSLRRSFRKKPEPQPAYPSVPVRPKPIEPQEEFVIRSRIADRCAAITPPGTRHTVAAISTPVPPPRTSSIRKRNRLNSTSSSGANPFENDVTPLFPDTSTSFSRHTLNIPSHGHGMYGSQSILRTSCESICTVGGTRRKKRTAPQPPKQEIAPEENGATLDKSVAEELQRIQFDIKQMTEDLNQNTELLVNEKLNQDNTTLVEDSDPSKPKDIVIGGTEVTVGDVDALADDVTQLHVDSNKPIENDRSSRKDVSIDGSDPIVVGSTEVTVGDVEILADDVTQLHVDSNKQTENDRASRKDVSIDVGDPTTIDASQPILNHSNIPIRLDNEINGTPEEPIEPVEYVSSETIVLKRNVSRRDTNGNETPISPVELTTFQPIQRVDSYGRNNSLVQVRRAQFEARMAGEEMRGEEDLNHLEVDSEKVNEVDVDINSNEILNANVEVFREKLKSDEAHMRYIDDDRDDILEIEDSTAKDERFY